MSTRLRAIALYKELHRLGRAYPDKRYNFHGKLRKLFEQNRSLTDPEEIEKALKLGEYIKAGVDSGPLLSAEISASKAKVSCQRVFLTDAITRPSPFKVIIRNNLLSADLKEFKDVAS
ncbi:hypothetical protein D9757_001385 [Collybiopsis confluens]|uniref:Complex 1 LYR protein domain-containing protein n=1 Tax=Collybiopsis confluens TaxID=2823264 RepID=A0A8H5MF94_9AGAR|nr:hypothetical protein D9757_001385 [Collybiopsis confluens]